MDQAPATIDLAFIDAIHTPEFVKTQLDLVLERSRSGTLIVLDDINFSEAMSDYWKLVRDDRRFSAAAEIGRRVGILELASPPGAASDA